MSTRASLSASEIAKLHADDVVALWERVERVKRSRTDPEDRALGRVVINRALAAGQIDQETAQSARAELEEYGLSLLLAGRWRELTPAAVLHRPTIGHYRRAFPRREREVAPTPVEWIADDPRRLGGVVQEMARFTADWPAVAAAVADLADAAGIEEVAADRIIADAIREARQEGRRG